MTERKNNPDLENISDQTYSCPRDWCLSALWGPNWGPPETPHTSQPYRIEGFKGTIHAKK